MTFTPKYSPTQLVWGIFNGKALELPINEVQVNWKKDSARLIYWFKLERENDYGMTSLKEEQLFNTKEELINSL
jgi:hypothetical protein